jgi:cytochrome c peroxidase
MIILKHKKILLFSLIMFSWSTYTSALTTEQRLGKKLFTDINLSILRNQSCESCPSLSHLKVPTEIRPGSFKMKRQPALGFVDPENVQHGTSVANGSLARKFGSLNPQSVGYAGFSPNFH